MIKRLRNITTIFLLLGIGQSLPGQQAFDARAAGMAFSNGADTRGLQSVGLNPATLALKNDFKFEFNLFSVNATANNNSFRKSQYDEYFTTGKRLTSEDIQDILSSIPEKGLRVDGFARVNTLAFYMPNFSISFVGIGVATATVPRSAFELPLNGNAEPGRIYNLDNTDGGDWVGTGVLMSGALPLLSRPEATLNLFSLGATVKYITGYHYIQVEKSAGQLRDFSLAANDPYVYLNGEMEIFSSEGGKGFGADLGALATFDEKFTVGLTVLNLASSVKWDVRTEKQLLSIRGDSLSLPNRVQDSLIVHRDTTVSIGSFDSRLPTVLDLAMAYRASRHFLLAAEYEQGLNERMGGTTRARVSAGLEYTGLPVLPLRAGFTYGAQTGSSLALGFGIDLKNWYLDFAYLNHGSVILGDFKGMGLAISTRLRF